MPSGFQQDQNQLSPAFFRVVINMNNGDPSTEWYNQGTNEGDTTTGRITTWAWDNAENPADLPQTQLIADALARGNLRFQAIVDNLGMFADCQILDIENWANTNAEDQVNQDQIAFTVRYDRSEFLIPGFVSYANANYNNGTDGTFDLDGVTYDRYWSASGQEYSIDTEDRVVKELVYAAVARNNYRKSVRVFEPVEGADPMVGSGVQKVIEVDSPADNANDNTNIFTNITVTDIDGTTTTQIYD